VRGVFGWLKKEKKPKVLEEVLCGYAYIVVENGQLLAKIKWWPRDWPQPDPDIEGVNWAEGEEIVYHLKDEKRIRRELKDAVIKDVKIVNGGLWLDLEAKDYIFL
jgi:hypothetical protein